MNYFYIMVSIVSIDIGYIWFIVFSNCSNLFQNWSDQFIGFFLFIRYDGRFFQSVFFIIGNIGIDKVKIFGRQFMVMMDGVLEEGVVVINDDVVFVEVRFQGIDGVVGFSFGFYY